MHVINYKGRQEFNQAWVNLALFPGRFEKRLGNKVISIWCVFSLLNCIASITRQQCSTSQVSTAVQAGMEPLHLTPCGKSLAGLKTQQGSALTFCRGIIWQCFLINALVNILDIQNLYGNITWLMMCVQPPLV